VAGARERYRSAHEKGRALAELCRLQISRVPCAVMTMTALAAGTEARAVVSGLGTIGASCVVGAALNDRADLTCDRLNRRGDLLVRVGHRRMALEAALLGLVGLAGLGLTIGPGWWCVPAGTAVVALGLMARRGHLPALWSLARTALVVTAVVIGVHVAVA
jgi:4-hydroxybenzoate polyprenyltransferase